MEEEKKDFRDNIINLKLEDFINLFNIKDSDSKYQFILKYGKSYDSFFSYTILHSLDLKIKLINEFIEDYKICIYPFKAILSLYISIMKNRDYSKEDTIEVSYSYKKCKTTLDVIEGNLMKVCYEGSDISLDFIDFSKKSQDKNLKFTFQYIDGFRIPIKCKKEFTFYEKNLQKILESLFELSYKADVIKDSILSNFENSSLAYDIIKESMKFLEDSRNENAQLISQVYTLMNRFYIYEPSY